MLSSYNHKIEETVRVHDKNIFYGCSIFFCLSLALSICFVVVVGFRAGKSVYELHELKFYFTFNFFG